MNRLPHFIRWAVILLVAVQPMACGSDDGTGPAPTVTARVTHSTPGKLRCTDDGSDDIDTDALENELTPVEVFEFGDFALYVPARVAGPRALILALGGPDTRGFVTGKPLGAPFPEVEAALQALGQELRTLASACRLAVLGKTRTVLANSPASDLILLDAVQAAATLSGRPRLSTAPVLLYGLSGGGPQASGFAARNPRRVAGLFLKVPAGVTSLTGGDALGVPTFIVQAELDAIISNAAITAAFEGNRSAGALWARAMERGVTHNSLSAVQGEVTINWMRTILGLRLPARRARPLREIDEKRGWLGNSVTGQAVRWRAYREDRALASWLPSKRAAMDWERLVAPAPIP
jgi:pimeloyl-ACP methyl ester carboxylesterase